MFFVSFIARLHVSSLWSNTHACSLQHAGSQRLSAKPLNAAALLSLLIDKVNSLHFLAASYGSMDVVDPHALSLDADDAARLARLKQDFVGTWDMLVKAVTKLHNQKTRTTGGCLSLR